MKKFKYQVRLFGAFILCFLLSCSEGNVLDNYDPNDAGDTGGSGNEEPDTEVPEGVFPTEGVKIDDVLSSVNVGFDMIVKNGYVFMAYYDGDHKMTVARYNCETKEVVRKTLPSEIPWDTHNYVTMTFDNEGYLHVSGNMHATPLQYFRSEKPYDVESLQTINKMIGGTTEGRTTYPAFMDSPDGNLIFHYRYGGSGNGQEIYNYYDVKNKKWSRWLDKPLTDGRNGAETSNAYMKGPELGPDGYYHLIWVWRDTPDCSTNHSLSYARSKDLKNWETVRGEQTQLPITMDKKEFIVDPTPVNGGLFNGGITFGYDSNNRVVIGYHKYDENGNNQLHVARFENDQWKIQKLTDWNYRWEIGGVASVANKLRIWNPKVIEPLKMAFPYSHVKFGRGQQVFDENSLEPLNKISFPQSYPSEYGKVISTFPGMQAAFVLEGDYMLRWERKPNEGDKKPEGELPPPSPMLLFKYK